MSHVIELELDEREALQLREAAERAGVTPKQFVHESVRQAITATPDPSFRKAMGEVLEENRELFQRLAQ